MMKSLKRGSAGVAVLVSILLVLLIIIAVWVYLMKSNKFIGLGETLRPYIKDTPVLNMLLPEVPDESTPVLFGRDELEQRYVVLYDENKLLTERVETLEKEVTEENNMQEKYDILLKEVESLSKKIAEEEAQEKQEKENIKSEELKNLVKVYETMDAGEAAKILEQIGALNIELVVDICKTMKTNKFSDILVEMDDDFAAILSERMLSAV